MLDPRILKERPHIVRDMLKKRNIENFPLDELIMVHKRRGELIYDIQKLRQEKNLLSESIARKRKSKQDASPELTEMKRVSSTLGRKEEEATQAEKKFEELLSALPNLLDDGVPIGIDEKDNMVIRQIGSIKRQKITPRDHIDLVTALDLVDFERASKVSGARFYFLKKELVKMNQALVNFALDFLSERHYVLIQPPYMIRKEPMAGAVIMNDFQDVIYKVENHDLYMIGTSEHALA
ncbi:MAG TPA: serine--tRNA ligase, partial [Nitrososphaera sp.]